jgi:formamidopyrimidine-DNA glycosylase
MPELPEVEICRRNLERWAAARVVAHVDVCDPAAVRTKLSTKLVDAHPEAEAWMARLTGLRTTGWQRRGKRLMWQLGDVGLLLHLGMTGRWVRRRHGGEMPRAAKLGVHLDDGHVLWFADTRRFGCVVPGSVEEIGAMLVKGLGPDALEAPPSGEVLSQRMRSRGAIKTVLMDQARLAGVGNIQAVEALFRARIDPWMRADTLTVAQWDALADAIPVQLRHTIQISDDEEIAYMTDGDIDNPFEVYGRAGLPCTACGADIMQGRQGGRSTFWCAACQTGG